MAAFHPANRRRLGHSTENTKLQPRCHFRPHKDNRGRTCPGPFPTWSPALSCAPLPRTQPTEIKEAELAGRLLVSNLFQGDNYTDRAAPSFWLGFTFPFWFYRLIRRWTASPFWDFRKANLKSKQLCNGSSTTSRRQGVEVKNMKGTNKDILSYGWHWRYAESSDGFIQGPFFAAVIKIIGLRP